MEGPKIRMSGDIEPILLVYLHILLAVARNKFLSLFKKLLTVEGGE